MVLLSDRKRQLLSGGLALVMLSAGISLAIQPATAAPAEDQITSPWMDTSKTAAERTELLLQASSQHQKYRWLNEQAANSPNVLSIGGISYPAQLEGAPTVVYSNGPQGVYTTSGVTTFPVPLAIAASWNLELGYDKGAAHGSEAFDKGSAVVLGPGVASSRTPLSGRTSEYFGEDSLLSGLMAGANIRGLEKGNPSKPVLSNLKHYVANEQELDREASSSNMDERTFHEVYGLPFEVAVSSGDPKSAMCSYNQINGIYACENPLMNTHLRGLAGFDGYVMSDFGAVHSTSEALLAGLDQELNRPIWFTPEKLDAALSAGEITQNDIDTVAARVVSAYMEQGLFDHLVPSTPIANVSTAEHKSIARNLAEQGSVLLKNESAILPLRDEAKTIAVIGQTASSTPTDGISAKSACSSYLTFVNGPVQNCDGLIDPLTSFTERAAESGQSVSYASGADTSAAAAVAKAADVAVVFGYLTSGEFADIPDIRLDGNGDDLIAAVAASGTPTVVVLETGTAVEMPWINDVDAVLEAWYPGEQQGPALASLLWGDTNPSGKLPMTFPVSLADTPAAQSAAQYPGVFNDGSTDRVAGSKEIRQVDYTEGRQVGYKWYDEQEIEPLFEFGHGLSYTEFTYSDLAVKTSVDSSTNAVTSDITFTVKNSGNRSGTEVPQVYLALPDSASDPGKRLVGFDRLELEAGESTTSTITIDSAASNHPFSIWNTDTSNWQNLTGEYLVAVGSSSRALPLSQPIMVDLDAIAPVVTLEANPSIPDGAEGWYTDAIEITATASDDIDTAPSIEVSVDGGEWTRYTAPIALTADGVHTVSARATDKSGSVSPVISWTGSIDTVAPVITPTTDSRNRTVTLNAKDATSGVALIEYSLGTDPGWLSYDTPIALEATITELRFRATDVAGLTSPEGFLKIDAAVAPPASAPATTLTPTQDAASSPTASPRNNDNNLAKTGGSFKAGLIGGLLLLAAGCGAVLFRRRTTKHG